MYDSSVDNLISGLFGIALILAIYIVIRTLHKIAKERRKYDK